MNIFNNWGFILIACLTMGLAPFFPEPHIWGKLNWILGGANGMTLVDWGDFVMHGTPWVLLIRLSIVTIINSQKSSSKHPKT